MKRIVPLLRASLIFSLIMMPVGLTYPQAELQDLEEEASVMVGRISHIEGQLLRYVPEEENWVATVEDAPFGVDDLLYTSFDGCSEMIMPNNTWIRIDGDTQIQLVLLNAGSTELDLASGKGRFYNKSSDVVIKVTTPFGFVTAPSETEFDVYVGENAVEVIALMGRVYFLHNSGDKSYEVIAGSSSIFADISQVTASEGNIDPGWDEWNRDRDCLWAGRMQAKGKSAVFLPQCLHDEAYVLEKYGKWERVLYDGAYYYFWRPACVSVGWAPFIVGRWTLWHGDHIWIPSEPFGYITHHYGNWIFTEGCWYWAPPVTRVMVHVGLPLLYVGFGWYPGRVAWIHSGAHVGWVPLAPYEPYFCHRYWGRRSIVVGNVNIAHFHFGLSRYKHFKHAVIIHRNHFYCDNNYRKVQIKNLSHATVTSKYRMVPAVHEAIVGNSKTIKKKYNFTNTRDVQKPPEVVISKNEKSHIFTSRNGVVKGEALKQNIIKSNQSKLVGNIPSILSKDKDRTDRLKHVNNSNSTSQLENIRPEKAANVRAENSKKTKEGIKKIHEKGPPSPLRQKENKWKDRTLWNRVIQKIEEGERAEPATQQHYLKLKYQRKAEDKKQNKEEKRKTGFVNEQRQVRLEKQQTSKKGVQVESMARSIAPDLRDQHAHQRFQRKEKGERIISSQDKMERSWQLEKSEMRTKRPSRVKQRGGRFSAFQ